MLSVIVDSIHLPVWNKIVLCGEKFNWIQSPNLLDKKKRVYILFRQGQRKITITIIWRKKKCEKKTSEDFISLIVYYSTTAKESTNVFSSASVLKLSSTRYICIFCIVFSCKNRVKSVKAILMCVFLSCNQAVMNWLQSTLMIIPRSDCEL